MKRADHLIVQQVLDGSVKGDAFDAFQERMRREPELVSLYGDYANLHHNLSEEFEDLPISPQLALVSHRPASSTVAWWVAAAAVVLAGIWIYQKSSGRREPAALMANVRFSADAVWQVDGISRKRGDSVELAKGTALRLFQGQADVLSGRSASALIEGPAILTVVTEDTLNLAQGRGRFRSREVGARLEVTTPSMSAIGVGVGFGVEVRPDRPDELHVFDGKVTMRVNGNNDGEILSTGEAGRVEGSDRIVRFAADPARFYGKLIGFSPLVGGRFVKAGWRSEYGKPSISEDRIEGENYATFYKLPNPEPTEKNPVLLATLKVDAPPKGGFHTDGWAGMSFYSNGTELLFFGDSFGPERTWSLDVKQRIPVILPANPVEGPRTVTLRYDRRSGDVSLHEGNIPLDPAFCTGKLPVGLTFDEIRLGASSNAGLAVSGLKLQVGGEGR